MKKKIQNENKYIIAGIIIFIFIVVIIGTIFKTKKDNEILEYSNSNFTYIDSTMYDLGFLLNTSNEDILKYTKKTDSKKTSYITYFISRKGDVKDTNFKIYFEDNDNIDTKVYQILNTTAISLTDENIKTVISYIKNCNEKCTLKEVNGITIGREKDLTYMSM